VASNICQGLANVASHVIDTQLGLSFLASYKSCDVASSFAKPYPILPPAVSPMPPGTALLAAQAAD
jgi:hypothetical protein